MAFFTLKETQNEKPNHDFSGFRMYVQQEQMWDTRGHGKKLKKDICRRDIKKFSFPQRCVEARNGLEKGIVHARTVIDMETEQHEHIRTHTHTLMHTHTCTPMDTLFTPASLKSRRAWVSSDVGFTSRVTSAPSLKWPLSWRLLNTFYGGRKTSTGGTCKSIGLRL